MIEIANLKLNRAKIEWRQEVLKDFDLFVKWVGEHQPHADRSNVFQYVLEKYLERSCSEEFLAWREKRDKVEQLKVKQENTEPDTAEMEIAEAVDTAKERALKRARQEISQRSKASA